jgi:hypothetical protein
MIVNAVAASGPSSWAEDLVKNVQRVRMDGLFGAEPPVELLNLDKIPEQQSGFFKQSMDFA